MRIGHAVAFVAEGFRLFLELLPGINEHHSAAVAGGLLVSKQPDVGEDAGVVEKLVGQHDDGVEPVVLQNPAADFALTEPQSPLESGEPLKMMAMRLPPFSGGCILASMVCRKSRAPSFTRGMPAW